MSSNCSCGGVMGSCTCGSMSSMTCPSGTICIDGSCVPASNTYTYTWNPSTSTISGGGTPYIVGNTDYEYQNYVSVTQIDYDKYRLQEELGLLLSLDKVSIAEFKSIWAMVSSIDKETVELGKALMSEVHSRERNKVKSKTDEYEQAKVQV